MGHYATRGLVIHHWWSLGVVSMPGYFSLLSRGKIQTEWSVGLQVCLVNRFFTSFFVIPDTMFGCQFKGGVAS